MIRIGIIGTGRIAKRFVNTVRETETDIEVSCVYNPRYAGAEAFSQTNNIPKFTDSLSKLWDVVDAVYIASPHETHYEYAIGALNNGKHVLCEKPMSLKAEEVGAVYELADNNGLVVMEAIKTAYCEGFNELIRCAKSGVIGDIVDVEAAFTRLTQENLREFLNVDYGGSVLEFGSYVLLPIIRLLGNNYEDMTFNSVYAATGVDSYTKIHFKYPDALATAKTGLGAKSEGQMIISGTKGYIVVQSPWWMTRRFEIRYEDPHKREAYEYEYKGSGLQYEAEAFVKRIKGEDVAYGVTKEESMAIAGVIEQFLRRR